jgi:rhomboid protease GluP
MTPAPGEAVPVGYGKFAGAAYNPDFRGKGTFAVREAGKAYAFCGPRRGSVPFSSPAEQVYEAGQIWNVAAVGDQVQFSTGVGKAGSRRVPFVFYCDSSEQAAAVASLLPDTKDADFVETRGFAERLRQMSPSDSPWSSPTNAIVAANVAVFAFMGILGAGWFEVGDMMVFVRYGANNGAATTDGEWWRLLTSMFMHYGLMHLALNMWALYQVGHLLEKLLGRALYVLDYLGSGIIAGLASILWHGAGTWSAGASGAIFGVYGALLGYMLRERHALPGSVFKPLMKSTLLFSGYNLVYGLANPVVDNACHVGGLLAGLVLGWVTALPMDPQARAARAPGRTLQGAVVAAALVAAGIALTPRFDYRPLEEIQWQKVVQPLAASEREIVSRENAEITAYDGADKGEKLSNWVSLEALPFYEGWRQELAALELQPGRRTARRRDALVAVLGMKIDSYHHLVLALQGNDPNALGRYNLELAAIGRAVAAPGPLR